MERPRFIRLLLPYFPKNGDTNAVRGEYIGLDSTGNLVMGDHLVVTIGVHDTAIIDSGDVTLIAPRHRAEEAKQAVALLKQKGDPRADSHLTETHRPWGSYTRLEDGPSTGSSGSPSRLAGGSPPDAPPPEPSTGSSSTGLQRSTSTARSTFSGRGEHVRPDRGGAPAGELPASSPWRSSKSRSGSTSGRTISSGCRTIITALRNEEKAEYRGTVRF